MEALTKGVGHARQWGLGWCTHLLSFFFLLGVCPHGTVHPTSVEPLLKGAVLGLG